MNSNLGFPLAKCDILFIDRLRTEAVLRKEPSGSTARNPVIRRESLENGRAGAVVAGI